MDEAPRDGCYRLPPGNDQAVADESITVWSVEIRRVGCHLKVLSLAVDSNDESEAITVVKFRDIFQMSVRCKQWIRMSSSTSQQSGRFQQQNPVLGPVF
ncbi:hypothetical protein TNIN_302061 [Trichonephila inaurata madagascariensis]|uniref:Uncharacterized protein n=1 Tax=Trichonephila inaurata madagascariensis TaxID=2747483 RepID=A0A8X7CIM4_9ARAC|nr:hypothetical protein TNIN_302061 [Trichonephila inaurata madagascariensis]